MADREKLIEILGENISEYCRLSVIAGTTKITGVTLDAYRLADHLIANGVTFAKDTNVPIWIPVSERLPEQDGFVLVYTIDQIVGEAILIDGKEFYWAGSDDDAEPIAVTHWMPLPEPPKEG